MAIEDPKQLSRSLYLAGSELSEHLQSRNGALNILNRVEKCLSLVEQSPHELIQWAMSVVVDVLKQHKWLKHSDEEIKLVV
ncbi:hypothetical protein SUGI_1046830 [Cryptomeria japonica]|nr:hypothetical protein SUGI_1046830 [Cryptomeria japonica]